MKKLSIVFAFLFLSIGLYAQESIEGVWNTGKENTTVEIKSTEKGLEGGILSSDNAKAKIGLLIVKNLKQEKGLYKGKLYAVKKRKWLDATFEKKGATLEIVVSSAWGSKTIEWELVD
jgi:uncharacterized protein (DUF2147 family)